jgi:hypothetical protein
VTDDIDDLWAAARWLYGKDPNSGPGPVWPSHEPYVTLWCPNARRPCRIGAVYAAPSGFLLIALNRKHRKDYAEHRGHHSRAMSLLTHPDGSVREYGFVGELHCRHGRYGFGFERPLHEIVADVAAGHIRRPAEIVGRRWSD